MVCRAGCPGDGAGGRAGCREVRGTSATHRRARSSNGSAVLHALAALVVALVLAGVTLEGGACGGMRGGVKGCPLCRAGGQEPRFLLSCMEWGALSSAQEPQTRGPARAGTLPSLPKALSRCHAPEREGHQAGGGQGGQDPSQMACITGQDASQWPRPRSGERWVHPWPGRLCPWGKAPAPGDSSPRAGRVEAEVHTSHRQQATRRLHRCLKPLLPSASSPLAPLASLIIPPPGPCSPSSSPGPLKPHPAARPS